MIQRGDGTRTSGARRKLPVMSKLTAREACQTAIASLRAGRSPLIEPAQHDIDAAELVEIATTVRLELRSPLRVAWCDGAVRYVLPDRT